MTYFQSFGFDPATTTRMSTWSGLRLAAAVGEGASTRREDTPPPLDVLCTNAVFIVAVVVLVMVLVLLVVC